MNFDYAIHSNFLIHWHGKDFDLGNDWYENDMSKTTAERTEKYLERLLYILKFGLWMTEEDDQRVGISPNTIVIPKTPKCCFTELRLSEARRHAKDYGRLGIGVKRPFMFDRYGRPVAYFGYAADNTKDQFLKACADSDDLDPKFLNFFKPMNSKEHPKSYDLYRESEWRIIYFKELESKKLIIDPRKKENKKEHDYFNSLDPVQQEKLKYLIPLDGWLSMIIYPSLDVKNGAQQIKNEDNEEYSELIRNEIKRIKGNNDHANSVEKGNWPMEIDLDSCRNF